MIWRLRDLPELQHLSAKERHQLLKAIVSPALYVKLLINTVARTLAVVLVLYLTVLASDVVYYSITGGHLLSQQINGQWVLGVVTSLMLFLLPVMYLRAMGQIREQVRDALREAEQSGHLLPVCPDCAYGLEGIAADHCPECGRPLRHL